MLAGRMGNPSWCWFSNPSLELSRREPRVVVRGDTRARLLLMYCRTIWAADWTRPCLGLLISLMETARSSWGCSEQCLACCKHYIRRSYYYHGVKLKYKVVSLCGSQVSRDAPQRFLNPAYSNPALGAAGRVAGRWPGCTGSSQVSL